MLCWVSVCDMLEPGLEIYFLVQPVSFFLFIISKASKANAFFFIPAVVMSELVKLLTCLVLVFYEEGKDCNKFFTALHTTIIKNPVDTLKICVPSFVYIVQNNLLYLSASHLDAATYQVIGIKRKYLLPKISKNIYAMCAHNIDLMI